MTRTEYWHSIMTKLGGIDNALSQFRQYLASVKGSVVAAAQRGPDAYTEKTANAVNAVIDEMQGFSDAIQNVFSPVTRDAALSNIQQRPVWSEITAMSDEIGAAINSMANWTPVASMPTEKKKTGGLVLAGLAAVVAFMSLK